LVPACSPGGFYTIPAGKALIITSVSFTNETHAPGAPHDLAVAAGPSAAPCASVLAFSFAPGSQDQVTRQQVFSPGIAVPAGDALEVGGRGNDDQGFVSVYCYLVPASAVPAAILKNARAPGRLVGLKPKR
jgi:hypothetical protein